MQTDQPNHEDYRKAVEFLESFSNSSIRKYDKQGEDKHKSLNFYVDRTKYFLGLLGNPERGFKYVHITGTAGKGSVSTMVHEALVLSGKTAGLFTSPYVTTTAEQIKVNELFISPSEFVETVDSIRPFIEQAKTSHYGSPSAFELLVVIAILYFKKQSCDWVVLEVGMGGRYDATNVIENPAITAITNIGLDHTDILGKTVEEIAYDKMGIIKPRSAFFTTEQRPELQKMFSDTCKSVGAVYTAIGKQKTYSDYNAELVRAICGHLGVKENHIEKAISTAKLPCRFEVVQAEPLIILDGAHNEAKILSTISNLKKHTFKKLFTVLTVSDTKPEKISIVKPLMSVPYELHVIVCQITSNERKSVSPQFLLPIVTEHLKQDDTAEIIENPQDALDDALAKANPDDMILVTGSFFLAGELRKRWIPEDWVLENRRSFR